MRKRTLLALFLLFLIPWKGTRAANSLTSGADFLLMTTGARPDGMGQAFSAVADDINTLTFNPAGLGNIRLPEVGYGHESFFSDISYDFLGAAVPAGELGVLGLGYLGMGTPPFNSTADPAAATSSVMDQAFIGAWGKSFYDFHVGAALKYIQEKVDTIQGTGFAVDLGARFRILPQLTLAGAVLNLGSGIQFSSLEPLPLVANTGVAWNAYEDPNHSLTLAGDGSFEVNSNLQHYSVGAEYWFKDMVALRAGYLANSQDEGFSVGAGFKYQFFQLDYAFEPYNQLGSVHRFSGLLRWDGPWVAGGEPNAPKYVTARPGPRGLEIRWDKAFGPVHAYEVHIQPLDGREEMVSPAVINPVFLFKDWDPKTLYKITVRSVGEGGAHSYPSKETYFLSKESANPSPAEAVESDRRGNQVSVAIGLQGQVDGIGLRLTWNALNGSDMTGYSLYRQSPSGQVEKVSQALKKRTTLWVMDASGLYGWTWLVTGVYRDGRERVLGAYLWYPSEEESDRLAGKNQLRLYASPQPHRRVYLDWDKDPEAAGYSLLVSRAGDGVYELYQELGRAHASGLFTVGGKQNPYYFVVGSKKGEGQWANHTNEAKAELFNEMPEINRNSSPDLFGGREATPLDDY